MGYGQAGSVGLVILLFSADGGSRGRRASSSIQLHLLVLQTYPGETGQYSELRTEYKTDRQLRLGKVIYLTLSGGMIIQMDHIYDNRSLLVNSQIFDVLSNRWSSSGVSIVT